MLKLNYRLDMFKTPKDQTFLCWVKAIAGSYFGKLLMTTIHKSFWSRRLLVCD